MTTETQTNTGAGNTKAASERADINRYNPADIEQKWQKVWEETGQNHADDKDPRPRFYNLVMFPYPSGDLHIGHWYNFTGVDVYGRYQRMNGYNVMQPLGFDAFGLPAENAAIKRGVQARKWTLSNIDNMRRQFRSMGGIWDWDREVVTCLPDYYKWTEWLFLKLYEAGLAYRAKAPVNWCPNDQTVLANEQVLSDGTCERCGATVIKRDLEQWFFKITAYADRLLEFKDIEWPEKTMLMQKNWIGRSEGARVTFKLTAADGEEIDVPVFTTRPDTLYGVTFFLLAPEHPLVEKMTTPDKKAEMEAYIAAARNETEIERQSTEKKKTGVFTGSYATNPINGEKVPVWVTDYVLMGYGTGAVMGVPAHDQRDFEFARTMSLPVQLVYQPDDREINANEMTEALVHEGHVVNSGPFNGLPDSQDTINQFIKYLEEKGLGKAEVTYRLRDWLISRQRYWGAPIPMVYCDKDGIVPVPEDQLPVILPEEVNFRPDGVSPLKYLPEFVDTTCPKCGGPARRETDTMDTFMCSSWYFLRYCDPHDEEKAWDKSKVNHWMPVDQYTGGPEHATMHLLYARFFTKALHDMGLLDFEEPFRKLFHQGMIRSEGKKMSKSRGKTVAPDRLVEQFGADAVRSFLMFLGPFDQGAEWNDKTEQLLVGVSRFLNRVWNLVQESKEAAAGGQTDQAAERALLRTTHKTIERVEHDLGSWSFNTALSGLMEFSNSLTDIAGKNPGIYGSQTWKQAIDTMLLLLAPLAPHITEELWHQVGHEDSIHFQRMPVFDPALAVDEVITVVVQINGKVRDKLEVAAGMSEDEVKATVLASPKVAAAVGDNKPKKVIYVAGKLVNIVL
ncbi:MAG TPA: leucine--tRNA ligase [Chloroflexia bacterium]|nr:leucine--tRNA ligase [Chloroflexia bacterium]